MLTQLEIDQLQQQIQAGKKPEIYYVAHYIEYREGVIDEEQYKSVSHFIPVKITISEIKNAYFEVLNFKNAGGIDSNKYHIEEEEVYYDINTKYIHYYIVPNGKSSYTKDLNPRTPSIIYGYARKIVNSDGKTLATINEPSPVKAVFTNDLEYGTLKGNDIIDAYENKKLDWKYLTLTNKEIVDGVEYKYVTSDWYILKCDNFPKTEDILVNINNKNAYFVHLTDAFKYIQQLEA